MRALVVFADAMGPDQLAASGLGSLPHRRALDGVLGYSSGALATILTGAQPEVHGRMCLFAQGAGAPGLLAPLSWLGLLPRIVHERGAVRRRVARWFARWQGLTGYLALHRVPPADFRWLDIPEREDLFQAPRIGPAQTFLARAREAGLSVYASPWQLPERERWAAAHAALSAAPPELAFLYAADLDAALHDEGADGPRTRAARKSLAENVDRARSLMSRGGDCLTLVVGDHGMAEVKRAIDPRPLVKRLRGLRSFVDSTLLRLWGPEAALQDAARLLSDLPGRLLGRADLQQRRAPVEGDPYGSAIFVLDEGHLFAPSYAGGRVRGMHGYDLGSPSSKAAVASDVALPEGVQGLADLAPLICRTLGLA